ncbi:MAG: hypothetical protein FWC95_07445 [Defluviitaleaceae bacterium]|nr:hypothetical protein [Defluviitaleaceae bacterium]
MKVKVIIILSCLVFIALSASACNRHELVGSWHAIGSTSENQIILTLNRNGTGNFLYENVYNTGRVSVRRSFTWSEDQGSLRIEYTEPGFEGVREESGFSILHGEVRFYNDWLHFTVNGVHHVGIRGFRYVRR